MSVATEILPDAGHRAVYRTADSSARILGTITEVFRNGRIKFQPDKDPRWISLPRRYQQRIAGKQWGLIRTE